MKHTLELHRQYIALNNQGKPVSAMTERELCIVETETASFDELEAVQQELKKRGKIKQTGLESFKAMTGGNIVPD
jgi:hypothetical protein